MFLNPILQIGDVSSKENSIQWQTLVMNASLVVVHAIVAKENYMFWVWLCKFVKLWFPPFIICLGGDLCGELRAHLAYEVVAYVAWDVREVVALLNLRLCEFTIEEETYGMVSS